MTDFRTGVVVRTDPARNGHITEPLVYVVVPGIGPLGLTSAVLREARVKGRDLIGDSDVASALPAPAPSEALLVTAQSLALALGLPKSGIYEYARSGRIPSVRVGKHVRFCIPDVLAALKTLKQREGHE